MREKLFFVTLSIAVLLLANPTRGQIYSYEDTVSIGQVSGDAGDTLMIPVDLKNTFRVGGFLFRITYDTLAFEPVSVETTSRSGGFEWNGFNDDEPGVLRFFATSFHPLENAIPPGTGPISNVYMFVRYGAPVGVYDIRFENEDSTSLDNQLSDSLGTDLIIPVLMDGIVEVEHTTDAGSELSVPARFELLQNYPNPFNASTLLSFELPSSQEVELAIYDILGREVATPFRGRAAAGRTDVNWNGISADGKVLASGVYYYRLTTDGGKSLTRRMTLLK